MEKSIWILVLLFCLALAYCAFKGGIDRSEVVECRAWEQQAKDYDQFYIAKWQDEQCKAHKIIINAPIK